MDLKLVINIGLFAVGIILVVISFLTYTRKGESEISQDVLMTPKFIAGVIMIIVAAVLGFII